MDKHGGRKAFQLDIGVLLMEFGILFDWGDVKDRSKQPSWMRKKAVRPCECKFCFFCKAGKTNGIFHQEGIKKVRRRKRKAVNHQSSEIRQKKANVQCSTVRERFETSRYCGMCYRQSKVTHPHLKADVRKLIVLTKKSSGAGGKPLLGCLNCGERVCLACWPVYDHEPSKKTTNK